MKYLPFAYLLLSFVTCYARAGRPMEPKRAKAPHFQTIPYVTLSGNSLLYRQNSEDLILNPPVSKSDHGMRLANSFIGIIRNMVPQIDNHLIVSCDYLIEQEDPKTEFWSLSYFSEHDECLVEGAEVRVDIFSCKECMDDMVKISSVESL